MNYFTISTVNSGEFRDKGSKFFAFVHPIESLDAYKVNLQHYKSLHPKACHVCSAYRLYSNGELDEYASDDGEPRGSSGPPILNSIKRHEIINAAIYVVRYFGGTKLGISGLINAYGAGAEDALENITKKLWKPTMVVCVEHGYEHANIMDIVVAKFDGKIINQAFGESVESTIQLDDGADTEFDKFLFEKSNGKLSVKR
ncbi:MAG: YigZ family protein [Candidatus Marinimicrobia bacterium]|nr:YigZ family protein [Candidatus Neomarinimicrobiota bacterium]